VNNTQYETKEEEQKDKQWSTQH